MSKHIFVRDIVHELDNPVGKRGIVIEQTVERYGVRLNTVRWENGLTTSHKHGELVAIGNLLPGIDKRFGFGN